MALSLLFDGRFDDYVSAVREDARLWLFVHVPKTAGSSLGGELAALQPPYCNIHIDHLDRSKPGPERFDAAVDRFLVEARQREFHSASGHILNRHMEQINQALPGVRPLTMLRAPLSRLVSDYRYQRSPMHPLHEEVAKRTPDLESFLHLPGQRNRTARHLAPADLVRREKVPECVDYVLERFAFVGLQEQYDLSFRALTTLISGRARSPEQKKRVNEDGEKVDVTPDLAGLAARLNPIDFAIYDALTARFAAIEAPLADWLSDKN
jgi:hypothetical protein